MREIPTIADAMSRARELLEPDPNRWAHVQAVVAKADGLGAVVASPEERHLLVVAAWWHDLGYADDVLDTGCHQLDVATYLAEEEFPDRLVALLAHHSGAAYEAEERGLLAELNAFPREESPLADALWTADMTTGPRGENLAYPDRLADILDRHDPDSVVGRAALRAEPAVRAAIDRTRQRLASR
jgi:HD superfamily phosphodiesterase